MQLTLQVSARRPALQVEFQYLQLAEWPCVDHPGDWSLLSHGERAGLKNLNRSISGVSA
jgi:hypothetical protein